MTLNQSILFVLDSKLEVFLVDFVKRKVSLIKELSRGEKGLNLAEKFEFIWQDMEESVGFGKISEIYFWVGPRAGFTDARMIFMWLKSWSMFPSKRLQGKQFYIEKLDQSVEVLIQTFDFLECELNQTKKNGSQTLQYSQEPRIGVRG